MRQPDHQVKIPLLYPLRVREGHDLRSLCLSTGAEARPCTFSLRVNLAENRLQGKQSTFEPIQSASTAMRARIFGHLYAVQR
jgi:hypothetical protein